jgi:hypothetical protein
MLKTIQAVFSEYFKNGAVAVLFLIAVTGSLYISGCGKGAVKIDELVINVISDKQINDGRSVYIVLRTVNRMEFMVENYDGISDMVFANPQDNSVIANQMILPGKNEVIHIQKPEKNGIGIYALFSTPGDNWKIMIEPPFKPEYRIKVKKNRIEESP